MRIRRSADDRTSSPSICCSMPGWERRLLQQRGPCSPPRNTVRCSPSLTHTPARETSSRQVLSQKPAHVWAPGHALHLQPKVPLGHVPAQQLPARVSPSPRDPAQIPALPRPCPPERPRAPRVPALRAVNWERSRVPSQRQGDIKRERAAGAPGSGRRKPPPNARKTGRTDPRGRRSDTSGSATPLARPDQQHARITRQ